uniref:C-type lectin domain-containing protein n=1 Tax=Panagrellus redivivus TaxID=6233 RepID=A0A7E4VF16_PANRE
MKVPTALLVTILLALLPTGFCKWSYYNVKAHCIFLKLHPGSCIKFITTQWLTPDKLAELCWSKFRAVPLIPRSADDVLDIAARFHFFYVKSDPDADDPYVILGTQFRGSEPYRPALESIIPKKSFPDKKMWKNTVYRDSTIDADSTLNYPEAHKGPYIAIHPHSGGLTPFDDNNVGFGACESPLFPKKQCPKGWFYYNKESTCLKVFPDKTYDQEDPARTKYTFTAARKKCMDERANLASLTKEEYDIFESLKPPYPFKIDKTEEGASFNLETGSYWIGLRHENSMRGTDEGMSSKHPDFAKIYEIIAYNTDGTKYNGFHRFSSDEPTMTPGQKHFNGNIVDNTGHFRNMINTHEAGGGWCQKKADTSGVASNA